MLTQATPMSRKAATANIVGDYEIFSIGVDGTGLTNLSQTPVRADGQGAIDLDPTWSPDGSQIAFESDRDALGTFHIYRMDADGSDQIDLSVQEPSTSFVHDIQPTWSGTKIAFTRTIIDFVHNPFDVHTMNPDTRITSGRNDSNPIWSPNGLKIAFASGRSGDRVDLFVIDSNGTDEKNLTNGSAEQFTTEYSWAPDSTRLVYGDTVGDLLVIEIAGGTKLRLTDQPAIDARPVWAPDGSEIAFLSSRSGVGCDGFACNLHIWRIDAPTAQ
jgi:Tol biopolymer transport system component